MQNGKVIGKVKPITISKKKEKEINKILSNVLKEIKPSQEEQKELLNKVNAFCSKLQKVLGDKATMVLGGSLGKGTNLKQ